MKTCLKYIHLYFRRVQICTYHIIYMIHIFCVVYLFIYFTYLYLSQFQCFKDKENSKVSNTDTGYSSPCNSVQKAQTTTNNQQKTKWIWRRWRTRQSCIAWETKQCRGSGRLRWSCGNKWAEVEHECWRIAVMALWVRTEVGPERRRSPTEAEVNGKRDAEVEPAGRGIDGLGGSRQSPSVNSTWWSWGPESPRQIRDTWPGWWWSWGTEGSQRRQNQGNDWLWRTMQERLQNTTWWWAGLWAWLWLCHGSG